MFLLFVLFISCSCIRIYRFDLKIFLKLRIKNPHGFSSTFVKFKLIWISDSFVIIFFFHGLIKTTCVMVFIFYFDASEFVLNAQCFERSNPWQHYLITLIVRSECLTLVICTSWNTCLIWFTSKHTFIFTFPRRVNQVTRRRF